jgi:hypothetical protein
VRSSGSDRFASPAASDHANAARAHGAASPGAAKAAPVSARRSPAFTLRRGAAAAERTCERDAACPISTG